MLAFKGAARRRTPDGIARAAQLAGCEEAALEAVIAVESGKSGFDPEGRPTLLFEPAKFYKLLAQLGDKTKLAKGVRAGLAAKHWGEIPYGRQSEQYPRLEVAMAIDEDCALQAASWGAPQILGLNYKAAGYTDVEEMVADFIESEDAQLLALAKFLRKNGLEPALDRHDWVAFARSYNGPSWRKNDYATRLAKAYAHAKDETQPAPEPLDAANRTRAIAKAADASASAHRATAGVIVAAAPSAWIAAHAVHVVLWWPIVAGVIVSVVAALVIWNAALGLKKRAASAHAASAASSLSAAPAKASALKK